MRYVKYIGKSRNGLTIGKVYDIKEYVNTSSFRYIVFRNDRGNDFTVYIHHPVVNKRFKDVTKEYRSKTISEILDYD